MLLRSLVLLLTFYSGLSFATRHPLPVGLILSLGEQPLEIAFRTAINRANDDLPNFVLVPIVKYISFDDSFVMEQTACGLVNFGAIAIFGPTSRSTNVIVSSICHHIGIPHILFSWKDDEQDVQKMERTMTLNIYSDAMALSRAYGDFVEDFDWNNFIVLYETKEGLLKLQDSLEAHKPRGNVLTVLPIGDGPDYRPLLKLVNLTNEHNFVIDCSPGKMIDLLKQSQDLKLLKDSQNYFLTDLDTHTIDFQQFGKIEANITYIQLSNSEILLRRAIYDWGRAEESEGRTFNAQPDSVTTNMILMHDAVLLFATAFKAEYSYRDMVPPTVDCNSKEPWEEGQHLIDRMKILTQNNSFASEDEGYITGRMDLGKYGDRQYFKLDFLMYFREDLTKLVTWTPISGLVPMSVVAKKKIDEAIQNTTFIISAKIGAPFLMERGKKENIIYEGNARFEGYSVDLIQSLSEKLGFKYKFELAPGKKNGEYRKDLKKWDGIMGELIDGKADIGIGDLTITLERRQVVDFTVPFMSLGISILYSKPVREAPDYFSFLLPFSVAVWVYTAVVYLLISILLFAVARICNLDWESPHPCDKNPEEVENIWNMSNSTWLTAGSIMAQGCDLLPKSAAMRLVTGTWWIFALLMYNSYNANLVASITSSRMVVSIENVEDLAKQSKIKYGTLGGGSTQAFFRDSNDSLYRKMWAAMENARPSVFTESNDAGKERVLKEKRMYAFLMESTMIEYVREQHCELTEVGSNFGDKFYGIALPLGSRYRALINEEVLRMSETGEMYDLKMKWWKKDAAKCITEEKINDSEMSMEQVGAVFVVLVAGCFVGFLIGICEFLFNIQEVAANERITPWEALKAETKFALKFWIRHKPIKVGSSSSGSSSAQLRSSSRSMKSKSKSRFSQTRSVHSEDANRSIAASSMKSVRPK